MKTVLLTGFEPFGGDTLNPSALVAKTLDCRETADCQIIGRVLPCVFGQSLHELRRLIRSHRPDLVICTGLAGGRKDISFERIAINLEDAVIPDNTGNQPLDRPVVRGGPAADWSTLPIKATVSALRDAGLPAGISHSAGTFVCNHVFYGLMRMLARQSRVRGGFIHLPYLPEQARDAGDDAPSLPLKKMIHGLELVIHTSLSLTTRAQPRAIGGVLH
jgi:pyroglutamyl-peptidase